MTKFPQDFLQTKDRHGGPHWPLHSDFIPDFPVVCNTEAKQCYIGINHKVIPRDFEASNHVYWLGKETVCMLWAHSRGKLTWDRSDPLSEVVWDPQLYRLVSEWSHWENKTHRWGALVTHTYIYGYWYRALQVGHSLIPRPSPPPVRDCLQLHKYEGKEKGEGRKGECKCGGITGMCSCILEVIKGWRWPGNKSNRLHTVQLVSSCLVPRSCLERTQH